MSFFPKPVSFNGGMDRAAIPLRANPDSFYNLLNFRQCPTELGKLEQTPSFATTTGSQGTYYTSGGGTQTEPSTSQVFMATQSHIQTGWVLRQASSSTGLGSTQIKTYEQKTVPAGTGLTKGCAIDFPLGATFAGINLGGALDIVIDAATTFKWRVNGGAYTTGVAITTGGVSLGGVITVYFLTTSGFTVNDTWSWERTDSVLDYGGGNARGRQMPYVYHKDRLYFISSYDRVWMAFSNYAITVGYRPVYGADLTFFDDHLVIFDYYTSAIGYADIRRAGLIGWSDKTDYNNFLSTDTNEADTYKLPNDVLRELLQFSTTGITTCGGAVLNGQLFVFTPYEVYVTSALGLPLVFSFTKFCDLVGTQTVVRTTQGVYLIRADQYVVFFNGSTFNWIQLPFVPNTATEDLFGGYNTTTNELVLHSKTDGLLLIYQERLGRWYTRSASFVRTLRCMNATQNIYGGDNLQYVNQAAVTEAPSYDATSGTVYATPKITTQLIGGNLRQVKEIESTYLGCSTDSTASSTYYSTGANVQFKLHWYLSTTGLISGSPSTDSNATKVTSAVDGLISYPRTSFRAIALEIQVNGLTANKPPMQAFVTAIEPNIDDPTPKEPIR